MTLFLVSTEVATVRKLLLSGRARSVWSVWKSLSEESFVDDNEIPFSSIQDFATTLEMMGSHAIKMVGFFFHGSHVRCYKPG